MISEVALPELPIDPFIEPIRAALDRHRAAVVRAAPGAGKTTRVPPALVERGRVVLLQPRRVAARNIARRIADERGWTLGHDVGWHIRFERRFAPATRLLVVTEGMLTAYLDADPLLSDVSTVVLDEFHERSLHTDIGIALARQAWRARDDLRLLVMSATLEMDPISAFLDRCPVFDVPGTLHTIDIAYAPEQTVADAVKDLLPRTTGNLLCFLPGAGEIARAEREVSAVTLGGDVEVAPLHGGLDAAAQDRAVAGGPTRRIILATNIAETSLTVPGVAVVVDTGLQKVARYDAARGIDSLTLERVTEDSAGQRAGRAGRVGPGIVRRLWDRRDRLAPEREPEIRRVDLSASILAVVATGADPYAFEWFERPAAHRIAASLALLTRIGALDKGRLTPLGRQIQRLPLHPRLARVLLATGGSFAGAAACALLSDARLPALPAAASTTCDLLPLIDRWADMPWQIRQVADQLRALAGSAVNASHSDRTSHTHRPVQREVDDQALRKALAAGYPDRLARRRDGDPTRMTLASGHGAVMARESTVRNGEFLIALDVAAGRTVPHTEAIVRLASRVEREWIELTSRSTEHRFDAASGTVKAAVVDRVDDLVVAERPVAPEPAVRTRLLADAWLARDRDAETRLIEARAAFADVPLDLDALALAAAAEVRGVDDIRIAAVLPWDTREALASGAPEALAVPSGRSVRLQYDADGRVRAAVKLQELFGLAETPRIGRRREPVVFELLAPNGRPVQTTTDLRSFWERTYPAVRKELRGRYPKHPWPEDPWRATPTHRTIRKER